jgi:hypothetical protein
MFFEERSRRNRVTTGTETQKMDGANNKTPYTAAQPSPLRGAVMLQRVAEKSFTTNGFTTAELNRYSLQTTSHLKNVTLSDSEGSL